MMMIKCTHKFLMCTGDVKTAEPLSLCRAIVVSMVTGSLAPLHVCGVRRTL